MLDEATYRDQRARLAAQRENLQGALEEVEKDLEALERVWSMVRRNGGAEKQRSPKSLPPQGPRPALQRKKAKKAKRRKGSGPQYGQLISTVREIVHDLDGANFTITTLKNRMAEDAPRLLQSTSTASISSTIKRLASLGEIEVARRVKGSATVYRQVKQGEEGKEALF